MRESIAVLAEVVLQPGFEGTRAPDWTTVATLAVDGDVAVALRRGTDRPLVAVVRDAHRTAGMAELVRHRPDAIVVEMGIPAAAPVGATHIATYGAARACAEATAELLAGRR